MKYMGSKNRIAKYLKPFLEKNLNGSNYYVEPFVGGANMIDKIEYDKRIGGEFNEYLVEMWKELQKGWIPKDNYTKEHYLYVKDNKDLNKKETGYIGICCSYSGKWFGGFAGKVETKQGIRDYQREAYKNLFNQIPNLKGVKFTHSSYDELEIPNNSVIYCDPPYEGTTKYRNNFNHEKFWEWCRGKVKEGHIVYVSEYNAPNDFVCVWGQEVKSSLSANGKIGGNKKSIEKLFVHKDQLELCKLD